MIDFSTLTYGFIGLGLIGGSIAKAIRQNFPDAVILAYNPSPDTLDEAFADGVVNQGICSQDAPDDGRAFDGAFFESCDIVFLCAPVQKNAENLALIRDHLKPGVILTDIGSTKRDIHKHVDELGLSASFVGGHPMTGSERTRYRNSNAFLLENAYYMLTAGKEVSVEKTGTMIRLVSGLHALPLLIDPDFHDFAVAGISHVPHVISASLVNLVKKNDNADGVMHRIAAGGFRDITRISSSSPEMWQQICLTNGDKILQLLDDYIRELQDIRASISTHSGKEIYDFFDSARTYRDSFGSTSTDAADRNFRIGVDIADQPGMLAEVVTLLAVNALSIKNIGISHNREYQEGVLMVEFYTEEEMRHACEILKSRNFTVHE